MAQVKNPEALISEWKDENYNDSENHAYESGTLFGPGTCAVCGDDEAGLLHAFHGPDGYYDEAILAAIEAD